MQVNSINSNQQSFKANVVLNSAVLKEAEKAAVKPLLSLADNLGAVDEEVLRTFMRNFPDAKIICCKMMNSAKSPVQEDFNRKMDVRI